jgi:putative transcriptional regulator
MENRGWCCLLCFGSTANNRLLGEGIVMNSHLNLKNNLKQYRQAKNYTQRQLAEMIGATKNTISSIETGQFCPTAYLAALLCTALDCKFEDLFYLDVTKD